MLPALYAQQRAFVSPVGVTHVCVFVALLVVNVCEECICYLRFISIATAQSSFKGIVLSSHSTDPKYCAARKCSMRIDAVHAGAWRR